jgi:DNA mismatch endonuclease (patch repair protein)
MACQRSKEQISDIMRQVKSRDTTPEVMFRKALWARGVRYRLHDSGLPGRPDIVIPRGRLVVFIDGGYWHGNQWQTRGHTCLEDQFVRSPRAKYWVNKISGNMRRDRENTARLLSEGWRALRFWETDIVTSVDRSRLAERSVAEFFAGIGLMRYALEGRGWQVTFANDMDPQKYERWHICPLLD